MTHEQLKLQNELLAEMLKRSTDALNSLDWPDYMVETCGNIVMNAEHILFENKFAITDTNTDI